MRAILIVLVLLPLALLASPSAAADGEATVQSAMQTLDEVMSTPGKGIPTDLLQGAEGVAIIPNVIRVGVVAGLRRGKGVMVIRDKEGVWGLPYFITLTGGNLGFQIGAESSDVVLVFKTKRSVENLLDGKFTIGTDAGVAAGPVGRRVEAATDVDLKAEIYSYSRSRGLFAGVALDGSKIQLDSTAARAYYGTDGRAPRSATQLVELLAGLVEGGPESAAKSDVPLGSEVRGEVEFLPRPRTADTADVRRRLGESSMKLQAQLDEVWSRYLALPGEIFDGRDPEAESLTPALKNFAAVASDARYRALAELPDFQRTHALLRSYAEQLTPATPKLALPPPPQR